MVSRLVGCKPIDLAIEACHRLQVPLRIVGVEPERRALRRLAGPTIQFLRRLSDAEVAHEYARRRALIFPGEEDFGVTPVECMVSGRPIAAFGRGGALEAVTAGRTGVFFEEQTPEAVNGGAGGGVGDADSLGDLAGGNVPVRHFCFRAADERVCQPNDGEAPPDLSKAFRPPALNCHTL